jgi:hypothetical protein
MFYLTLVIFLEFQVMDEEKSDGLFKNCIGRGVFIRGKIEVTNIIITIIQKNELNMVCRKFGYGIQIKGVYFI